MDDLRATLLTFGPDDRRDFALFIQRQRRKTTGRQDVRLLELLLHPRDYPAETIIAKLYPDEPNPVAYYALRKRLLRDLTDYLLLRQREHDATAATSVRGQLSMAQYLFEAGVPRLAWAVLRKAEKLGHANEQYEPLNAVYNLQIQYADSPHADSLDEILVRRNRNKKAADEEERANIADSLLRLRLREARAQGHGAAAASFEQLVKDVLREYDLQEAFARSPSLLCRLMSIARSAMLVRGDFARFAPFLERCYRLMERRHGFGPAHRGYQLKLLYMLAHALYRSRHFTESVAHLEQGRALLAEGQRRHATDFGPRFAFLLAANYAFLRRNSDSIRLLTEALRTTPPLTVRDELTARLQLAFHYFAGSDFGKANQTLISIGRSDHWLEQQMGLEWLLAKVLSEMLVQFELENDDLALVRLRAIERLLRERFPAAAPELENAEAEAMPTSQEAGGPFRYILRYLALVREVMHGAGPTGLRRPAFKQAVEQLAETAPHQRDDLQARSFWAWLRSRIEGRPFYEVLLEVANG